MKSKIIFLASDCPFPLRKNSASDIRNARIIELLLEEGLDVELLCFRNPFGEATLPPELFPEKLRISWVERTVSPLWKRALSPLRPEPMNGYCQTMENALRLRAAPSTLLWVSRMRMGHYIPQAREMGYKVILDEQSAEASHLFERGYSSRFKIRELFLAAQCRFFEKEFCEKSHAVVASGDLDASRLQKFIPHSPIQVIPNGVDGREFELLRSSQGSSLLFLGDLSTAAAEEGLDWFMREVLPRFRASMGKRMSRIVVAGPKPRPALVSRLTGAGIEVFANPPSTIPFLADAAVVFFPYREEPAEDLPVLEAMAAGRAVVSTPKGIEGLVFSPTYDIWVADRPDSFTTSIVRLFEDPELRQSTGDHAVETIEKHYDWRRTRSLIHSLITKVTAALDAQT